MNEPLVKPAPDTKPKPRRQTPRPRPHRKNDPWTVPGPKVNPTPKAHINEEDMKEEKKMITMRGEFDLYSKLMTEEAFFNKFELSTKLTNELAAEDAVANVAFTDRQMTKEELQKEFFQSREEA